MRYIENSIISPITIKISIIVALLTIGTVALAEDPAEVLPIELTTQIFGYLDGRDLVSANLVSKRWNGVICSRPDLKAVQRLSYAIHSCGSELEKIDTASGTRQMGLFLTQYRILRLMMLEDHDFWKALGSSQKEWCLGKVREPLDIYYSALCAKLPNLTTQIRAFQKEYADRPLLCARHVLNLIDIPEIYAETYGDVQCLQDSLIGSGPTLINSMIRQGLDEKTALKILPSFLLGIEARTGWSPELFPGMKCIFVSPAFYYFSEEFTNYLIQCEAIPDLILEILRGIEMPYRAQLLFSIVCARGCLPGLRNDYSPLVNWVCEMYDQNPEDLTFGSIADVMAGDKKMLADSRCMEFIWKVVSSLKDEHLLDEIFLNLTKNYESEDWDKLISYPVGGSSPLFRALVLRTMARSPRFCNERRDYIDRGLDSLIDALGQLVETNNNDSFGVDTVEVCECFKGLILYEHLPLEKYKDIIDVLLKLKDQYGLQKKIFHYFFLPCSEERPESFYTRIREERPELFSGFLKKLYKFVWSVGMEEWWADLLGWLVVYGVHADNSVQFSEHLEEITTFQSRCFFAHRVIKDAPTLPKWFLEYLAKQLLNSGEGEEQEKAFLLAALLVYRADVSLKGIQGRIASLQEPRSQCIVASYMARKHRPDFCDEMFRILDVTESKKDRKKLLCTIAYHSNCERCWECLIERMNKLENKGVYKDVFAAMSLNKNLPQIVWDKVFLEAVEKVYGSDEGVHTHLTLKRGLCKKPYNIDNTVEGPEELEDMEETLARMLMQYPGNDFSALRDLTNKGCMSFLAMDVSNLIDKEEGRRGIHSNSGLLPMEDLESSLLVGASLKRGVESLEEDEIGKEKEDVDVRPRSPKRQKANTPVLEENDFSIEGLSEEEMSAWLESLSNADLERSLLDSSFSPQEKKS